MSRSLPVPGTAPTKPTLGRPEPEGLGNRFREPAKPTEAGIFARSGPVLGNRFPEPAGAVPGTARVYRRDPAGGSALRGTGGTGRVPVGGKDSPHKSNKSILSAKQRRPICRTGSPDKPGLSSTR